MGIFQDLLKNVGMNKGTQQKQTKNAKGGEHGGLLTAISISS
jgi:hypothetical protein